MTCTARSIAPRASSPVASVTMPWAVRHGSMPRRCLPTSCYRCTTRGSSRRCMWSMRITRFTAVTSTTRRVNWCVRWTSCTVRSNTNTKPMVNCAAVTRARSRPWRASAQPSSAVNQFDMAKDNGYSSAVNGDVGQNRQQ